jgi:putative flavoprotein involved in K+ transport
MQRVLARIALVAEAEGAPRQDLPASLDLAPCARERLDLRAEGIGAVVWATGFRRDLHWLQVPGALDAAGEILHRGGVTPAPGLFALGLPFLRCRRSTFLEGVGGDAGVLAWHLLAHLAQPITAFGRVAA